MSDMIYPSCPVFSEHEPFQVTSPFGYRVHPITGRGEGHKGVDIISTVSYTAKIVPIAQGTVIKVGYDSECGYNVSVQHSPDMVSMYFHLERMPDVKVGQDVTRRKIIGQMGSTGCSTGYHLHFQLERGGVPIDGLPYLTGEEEVETLTYAQWKAYQKRYEEEKAKEPATDEAWAKDGLAWAVRDGIMQGDESGNLMPRSYVTREQMAAMLQRYDGGKK